MHFDDMNQIQRRLHNAAIVLGADGDEHGFEKLQRDAISEIEAMRSLARDAYDAWDHDRDAKVGKLLRAIMDDDFRAMYRHDLAVPNAQLTGAAPRNAEPE